MEEMKIDVDAMERRAALCAEATIPGDQLRELVARAKALDSVLAEVVAKLELRAEEARLDRERRLSHELLRPFRMMKTKISRDGNQWCVLYGENLQDGVAGLGDTPDLASRAFDKAWYEENP